MKTPKKPKAAAPPVKVNNGRTANLNLPVGPLPSPPGSRLKVAKKGKLS